MAIRNWHVGKLVLLWAWGLIVVGVAFSILEKKPSWLIGYSLIVGMFAVPAALSAVTWKWLGGRDTKFSARRE